MPTLFSKIIRGDIAATFLHQDDLCVAFYDISPQAPHHILIVPKQVIARLGEAVEDDAPVLGHMMVVAARIARKLGFAESGFRLVINSGMDGGETVPHLHMHLLGGRSLEWPPG